MEGKIHWHLMSWQEIRDARKRNPVVIIPAGTVETQGPYTYVGLECVVPQRIAEAVAQRTNALITPTIPFGYSALFQDFPGTITVRPEILTGYYEDVVRSIVRHGFDHVLILAMHIPNQPMMEHMAHRMRDELGVMIAWINPGRLSAQVMREVSPDYEKARGHGADPGLSMALYLEPDAIDLSDLKPNEFSTDYQGLPLDVMTPVYNGFPLDMAVRLQDLSPESGGYGDPRFATAEQGEVMFNRIVDHVTGLVETFAEMDTGVEPWSPKA